MVVVDVEELDSMAVVVVDVVRRLLADVEELDWLEDDELNRLVEDVLEKELDELECLVEDELDVCVDELDLLVDDELD